MVLRVRSIIIHDQPTEKIPRRTPLYDIPRFSIHIFGRKSYSVVTVIRRLGTARASHRMTKCVETKKDA